MQKLFYTRSEFYDLAWSKPVSQLAKELGMSDVGLAKKYRALSFPLPARGYWAKLQAGKQPTRPPLPERPLGETETIHPAYLTGGWRQQEEDRLILEQPIPPPPEFPETLAAVKERLSKDVSRLKLKATLSPVHHALQALLSADEKRVEEWRREAFRSWMEPYFVSKYEKRRLRIINAIFTAVSKLSAKPSLRGKNPGIFYVQVGSVPVEFVIDAPSRARDVDWRERGWRPTSPTGRSDSEAMVLEIHAGGLATPELTFKWKDSPEKKIEEALDEIVLNLLLAGEAYVRASDDLKYKQYFIRTEELLKRIEERKEAEIKAERERLLAERLSAIEALRSQLTDFTFAQDVRRYVSSVRERLDGDADSASHAAFQEWSRWALAIADQVDPVQRLAFLERPESPKTSAPQKAVSTPTAIDDALSRSMKGWNPNAWYLRNR